MTEEELADQQEKMFAASRARFEAGPVPEGAAATAPSAHKEEEAMDDDDEEDEDEE